MVIGFTWGGWVTGGRRGRTRRPQSETPWSLPWRRSVSTASGRQDDAAGKIAELTKASTWDRGNVVAKSGFATMPGAKDADSDVARACAEMLASPPTPKT